MLSYSDTATTYGRSARRAAAQVAPDARDELITSHLPKVKYIADRIAAKLPPSVERDDLYGAGVVGLIDAVERFDASRGIAFTTFAELRVRGAILDNLRAHDWASRSARRRAREIAAAQVACEQRKGDVVTDEEVATYMNIPVAELRESLREIRGLKVSALDERDEETGLSVADLVPDHSLSPLEQLTTKETRTNLAKAIDSLPEREKQVISLYYVDELTMKEIGDVLGVTESRVSQLRSQAIVRLKGYLAN
jgi:RNA polymerase sigma factor for flagellar operon FliA